MCAFVSAGQLRRHVYLLWALYSQLHIQNLLSHTHCRHTLAIAWLTRVYPTSVHCLYMLFACPCIRMWVCRTFCLRCWPRPWFCHLIILTLVPLCSRKGLTLCAIYADWLDRPGIPKVWRAAALDHPNSLTAWHLFYSFMKNSLFLLMWWITNL